MSSGGFDRANEGLRDAARCLASVRDADVLVATLRSILRSPQDTRPVSDWTELSVGLENRRRAVFDAAFRRGGPAAQARERLDQLEIEWPDQAGQGDQQLLRVGLSASYEAVQNELVRISVRAANDGACHALRKRVKDVRHQIEFLHPTRPEELDRILADLHPLSDLLGEANDLAVLGAHVASFGLTGDLADALSAELDERKSGLWAMARRTSERVFSEKVEDFVGRVARYWALARP